MVAVRPESGGDADRVRAVVEAAFPTPLEARLVEALRNGGRLTVSLVAGQGDRVVGHVAFGPVPFAGLECDGAGLAPLAVLPERQRQGIGSLFVNDGIAAARTAGVGFVVVPGEPAYYSRFGFVAASRWGL